MSLREQILAAQDRPGRKPVKIDVPEWGFPVWLRVLSVADQMALAENPNAKDMAVRVIVACITDEEGNRVLQDGDAEVLAGEDFPLMMRLFSEAAKLNGLTSKEFEEAVASFEQARDESPSTSSPSPSGAPSENSKPSIVLS